MPDASAEGRPDDSAVLGLTYQSLMARYSSNFATEWQILGLGLTAQGFIVAASSAVENRVFTASSLAVVILLVGAVTVISRCATSAEGCLLAERLAAVLHER